MKIFGGIDKIIELSAFPQVVSLRNELLKIGLLRILIGVVVFVRYAQISHSLYIFEFDTTIFIFSLLFLVVIFNFTVGFLTTLSSLIILFCSVLIDSYMGTGTLGTSILQVTMLPFVLINSGQFYSIDSILIKRNKFLGKLIKQSFLILGSSHKNDITRAYFLAFCIYSLISFGALLLHIQDEYWIEGLTTKTLLLNSYLCEEYNFFRSIENNVPYLLSFLSIGAGIFQSIFQFLMPLLIFFKLGRKFIFYWGLIFFLISLFFINLSYLPHIELVLWFLILAPTKLNKNNVEIFYDDYCSLCKRAMQFFKLINFNGNLVFSPASKNENRIKELGVSEKELKTYMTGLYKGKLLIGYNLYITICKVNPILWLLVPILIVGKIVKIGPSIYNYIAERRYKLFQQCKMSFDDEIARRTQAAQLPKFNIVYKLIFLYFLLHIPLYIIFKLPYISTAISQRAPVVNSLLPYVRKSLIYTGFDLPKVFNKTDLSMGSCWMEIYREDSQKLVLIPMTGTEGERLTYNNMNLLNFSNHNSDFLYFGTTLQLRRYLITESTSNFMEEGNGGWNNLNKRIQYDYKMNNFTKSKKYHIKIYRDNSNHISHAQTNDSIYIKRLEYEADYNYENEIMTILQ